MTATRTDDTFTPYAAAAVVNGILSELGLDKVLPPQMIYNYTTGQIKKGKKPMIEVNEDGRITNDGLFTWTEKYLNKNFKVSLDDLTGVVTDTVVTEDDEIEV
jgi:hypothetical protein